MAMKISGLKKLAFILVAACTVVAAMKIAGMKTQQANANTQATQEASAPATVIDIDAALAPRAMGDENAPVTVEEFASLTCSHCAQFNKTTFDSFKEKYIDTGKVRFVYNDFPLNAPALEAAMVARCLPAERYFQFIKFLFETQNDWAFGKDYRAALKQNSKLLGLSDEKYDACVANEKLKGALVEKMQTATKAHEISSTPTFIINGKEKINGAQPLTAFQKMIDPLLEAR